MPSNFEKLKDMRGMRGRFLRKLKLVPPISNLKQGIVLQLNPHDVFCIQKCPTPPVYDEQDQKGNNLQSELEVGLNGCDGDKTFEEEEKELEVVLSDNDKATPTIGSAERQHAEEKLVTAPYLSETNKELNSLQQAVACSKEYPSLADFEEICPPGGSHSIILYTTSMRGIRKTFQDCKTIRFLLRSFKIIYHERDVSLHLEYREELWKILGGKVTPPKLFIKGRYIGGADEVVGLHEMGWLGKLLEGTPIESNENPCTGCANVRFAICSNCSGSCKVFTSNGDNNDEFFIRCPECNENGLVKCPICC